MTCRSCIASWLVAAVLRALLVLAAVAGFSAAAHDEGPKATVTACLDPVIREITAVAVDEKPVVPCGDRHQQASWKGEAIGVTGKAAADRIPTGGWSAPGCWRSRRHVRSPGSALRYRL